MAASGPSWVQCLSVRNVSPSQDSEGATCSALAHLCQSSWLVRSQCGSAFPEVVDQVLASVVYIMHTHMSQINLFRYAYQNRLKFPKITLALKTVILKTLLSSVSPSNKTVKTALAPEHRLTTVSPPIRCHLIPFIIAQMRNCAILKPKSNCLSGSSKKEWVGNTLDENKNSISKLEMNLTASSMSS